MHKIYIQQSLQNIMDYNCKILDIRERFGNTGYIDFIKQSEVTENIMKGIDDNERPFIVFKAEFVYNTNNTNTNTNTNNKNTKIIKKTFTTFFQRYTDNKLLWHTCGHDGELLFDSNGGANLVQLKMVEELLKNGYIDLTPDMDIYQLRLKINYTNPYPIRIQLGHSS
jgi:hypothetical protein